MEKSRTLSNTLTLILAGGQGERLAPLTRHRSKPSVSFGGMYRIIDFTLSNCLNSGLRRIYVLTQYHSLNLDQHIKHGWDIFSIDIDEFIYSLPPQRQFTRQWYRGTADAVYQNVYLLNIHRPRTVLVLSGDHVYKMDYYTMIEEHERSEAEVTIGAVDVGVAEARRYGVIQTDETGRVIGFQEKPANPVEIPGRPGRALCNMGVYVFNTETLVRAVMRDAKRPNSRHDFGGDVLPELVRDGLPLRAFRFGEGKEPRYWRDIGTLDSYYEASMDLVAVQPSFNLYDREWPIRSYQRQYPPVKTVFADEYMGGRLGTAVDSLLSPGCILSGARVVRSILSYNVRVKSYSHVADSILMENVTVGRHSRLKRCIIDTDVQVPEDIRIGYDLESDAKHFTVTESGIVVVPTDFHF